MLARQLAPLLHLPLIDKDDGHLPAMSEDSGTPTDWLAPLSDSIVHLHCICDPEIAAQRFISRTRHPGHLDASRSPDEIGASIRELAPLPPLDLGARIDVDTSVAANVAKLASSINCRWR